MNHKCNGHSGAQLMNYEPDPKKRAKQPTTTVSVEHSTEVNIGDTFEGQTQLYTVGVFNFRRKQNMKGRDLISFESTT